MALATAAAARPAMAPAMGLGAQGAQSRSTSVGRASHAAPLRRTARRGGAGARGVSAGGLSAGVVVRAAAQPWGSSSAASASSSGSDSTLEDSTGWAPNGSWIRRAGTAAVAAALAVTLSAAPALADSSAETGNCLLANCPLELAECLVDEKCAESLVGPDRE